MMYLSPLEANVEDESQKYYRVPVYQEEDIHTMFVGDNFTRRFTSDTLPDFVKLAEAYGHVGMRIDKPSDVDGALREAFKLKDRLVFMDFITDQSENVWPMVKAGKGLTEMLLGSEDL